MSFVNCCLQYDKNKRWTAAQLLKHRFLQPSAQDIGFGNDIWRQPLPLRIKNLQHLLSAFLEHQPEVQQVLQQRVRAAMSAQAAEQDQLRSRQAQSLHESQPQAAEVRARTSASASEHSELSAPESQSAPAESKESSGRRPGQEEERQEPSRGDQKISQDISLSSSSLETSSFSSEAHRVSPKAAVRETGSLSEEIASSLQLDQARLRRFAQQSDLEISDVKREYLELVKRRVEEMIL